MLTAAYPARGHQRGRRQSGREPAVSGTAETRGVRGAAGPAHGHVEYEAPAGGDHGHGRVGSDGGARWFVDRHSDRLLRAPRIRRRDMNGAAIQTHDHRGRAARHDSIGRGRRPEVREREPVPSHPDRLDGGRVRQNLDAGVRREFRRPLDRCSTPGGQSETSGLTTRPHHRMKRPCHGRS